VYFGILKKQFIILKRPLYLQRLESIEHLFLACAVLNNMLIAPIGCIKATDDFVLLVDVEEEDDDHIPSTLKEAYLNQQRMLKTHFKVASEKKEVKWV
jgi:hypothetical protein